MEMEKDLNLLVERLNQAAGSNLKALILYGSAVTGEFHKNHSDLNTLCVVERLEAEDLRRLNPTIVWWVRRGHTPPRFFTREELARSADVFAIEWMEIRASHRLLAGEDFFSAMDVPTGLHRVQVERELRIHLLRLRQSYVAATLDASAVLGLMTGSISSFATLFRHALIALGLDAPQGKRQVFDRLAELLGFDPSPFHTVLDVRAGQCKPADVDAQATFRAYLAGVVRVTEEVDRRLAR